MTRSVTPTDRAKALPRARVWQGRAGVGPLIALAVYVPGVLYVLAVNRWHLTAPVVMLLLCWAAVVTLGYHLTRMATVASDPREVESAVTSTRDELEAEKRKLVKAIKEIEFDRECGKMSEADATVMIADYRQRAIAILKDLERLDAARPGSPRARVEADLRARRELDARVAAVRVAKAKAARGQGATATAGAGDDGGDA
jgi:hypothetical protein